MRVGTRRIKWRQDWYTSRTGGDPNSPRFESRAPITLPEVRIAKEPFDVWLNNLEEKLEDVQRRQRIAAEEKHAREFSRHMCHDPTVNAGPLRRVDLQSAFSAPSRKSPYDGA